ncbi:MAG: hypothetical protein DMF53_27050 [Acidobacteria bacterium]|nr:MAG: hypothetical protein DMF53_27050 [Acidobacteriota bacterium]
MSFSDVLKKFVVFDDDRPEPRPTSVPDAPPVPPAGAASPSPAAPQLADFDFADLYQKGGIPPAALTAEQALEILGSLPKELSPETQRQVFKELLRAKGATLGVPPEAAMEDARRKIDILSAEAKAIPEKLAEFTSSMESEIENLEEQIRERKKAIDDVKEGQQQAIKKCHSEIERLTRVLQLLQTPGGRAE